MKIELKTNVGYPKEDGVIYMSLSEWAKLGKYIEEIENKLEDNEEYIKDLKYKI